VNTHKSRVGFIGTGNMADWHARALRVAGFELTAACARPGSRRLAPFAERHGIAHVYEDWETMLSEPKRFDALVIATPTDASAWILEYALDSGIPILVEKPVARNSSKLASLCRKPHDRVIVGYNRRFYASAQKARSEVQQGPPLLIQMSLPEDIVTSVKPDTSSNYLAPFFENSCHGIDLLRFLAGDLRVETVRRLETPGAIQGLAAVLSTQRGDIIQFTANWGTPANFSISLHRPGRRLDLSPFEVATIFEGMDTLPPSDEYPVRRYIPRETGRVSLDDLDLREKPGFVRQALALKSLVETGVRPPEAASLHDAMMAIRLCEELAGVQLS